MTSPYDDQRPLDPQVPAPSASQHQPGAEPLDPWAEEEARRQAEQQDRWVAEEGGLGPLPARTWSRGNTRVTVGGCCLPLPIGCLTTLVAGAAVAVSLARRGRR